MNDIYQERYLAHQAKKKEQLQKGIGEPFEPHSPEVPFILNDLLYSRRSQRNFIKKPIEPEVLDKILDSARIAPNSCNRHGIRIMEIHDQTDKDLLTGILVGGVGWVHRADIVFLFIADPDAYKSPNEKDFMHYCDVGFTAMSMWLTAEAHNVGAAYINPNIREQNKELFIKRFADGIFCGALALGYYDSKSTKADTPTVDEIMI